MSTRWDPDGSPLLAWADYHRSRKAAMTEPDEPDYPSDRDNGDRAVLPPDPRKRVYFDVNTRSDQSIVDAINDAERRG